MSRTMSFPERCLCEELSSPGATMASRAWRAGTGATRSIGALVPFKLFRRISAYEAFVATGFVANSCTILVNPSSWDLIVLMSSAAGALS